MQLKKQSFLEKNEKLTMKEFATVLFVSFYPQSDSSSQKSSNAILMHCYFVYTMVCIFIKTDKTCCLAQRKTTILRRLSSVDMVVWMAPVQHSVSEKFK